MSLQTAYLSVQNYSEKQKREVFRLLDSLAKSENRLGEHYSLLRSHPRQRCQNILHLRLPAPSGEQVVVSAYMRDVSPGGTSFIYPGELDCHKIYVGIPIPGRDETWFQGEIVRRKQIMDQQFWDYGVKFKQRLI